MLYDRVRETGRYGRHRGRHAAKDHWQASNSGPL